MVAGYGTGCIIKEIDNGQVVEFGIKYQGIGRIVVGVQYNNVVTGSAVSITE